MKQKHTFLAFVAALFAVGAPVVLASGSDSASDDPGAVEQAQRPSYPFQKCLVSGKEFGPDLTAVPFVHDGRLYLTCCGDCKSTIKADSAKYAAMIEKAVIEQQVPIYPTDMCVVSDEGLEDMGRPVELVHGTRLVRLCCKSCKKAFYKDPEKFIAMIDAKLIEAQEKDYPLKNCVVSDKPLGSMGEPMNVLYGTTLVRLCCKGCKKTLFKKPEVFVAKIREAREKS